jgi:hypothetical protein
LLLLKARFTVTPIILFVVFIKNLQKLYRYFGFPDFASFLLSIRPFPIISEPMLAMQSWINQDEVKARGI